MCATCGDVRSTEHLLLVIVILLACILLVLATRTAAR
jgi:hypothetical protein